MNDRKNKILFCIIGIISAIIVTIVASLVLNNFTKQIGNNSKVELSQNKKTTEASKKLKDRYNENFVIKKVYPQKIGQNYYEVLAYPEKRPDILFGATIDTKDENFSDNYVERHICEQISNKISANIALGDRGYIFTDAIGPQPITSDLEQSIQEYLELDSYNKFLSSIFITYDTYGVNDSSIVFSGLEYLDISAEIYTVSEKQLQEVKKYFSNNEKTDTQDYRALIKDFTHISI